MNARLQIAAMAMQTLLKRAKKPFTFQEIAHDALGYADALIDAAWEGGMSEKPTSHSAPSINPYTDFKPCPNCNGTGRVYDGGNTTGDIVCPICWGAGILHVMPPLSTSEIQNHSEPVETIKSDWSIRSCFEGMRQDRNYHLELGDIRIPMEVQDEICDLVERFYRRPTPLPSVEEMLNEINRIGKDVDGFGTIADVIKHLHRWLTERAMK